MKMELLENGCLKILLTEEDLQAYNITFDELDYNNETTRSVLHQLLEIARRDTGFDSSGSLIIEALPVDNGCLLLLTPAGGKRHIRMKRVVGPYIYELDDVDDVLCFARSMDGRTPVMLGSSLYQFGDRYRLILYPGSPIAKEVVYILHEYAHIAGEGDAAAAYTAEHGHPIAVGDALGQLCTAMRTGPKAGGYRHP